MAMPECPQTDRRKRLKDGLERGRGYAPGHEARSAREEYSNRSSYRGVGWDGGGEGEGPAAAA